MISRRSQKKDGPMSGWQWSYEWLAVVFYNFEDKPMVKIMANSHHQIPMPFFSRRSQSHSKDICLLGLIVQIKLELINNKGWWGLCPHTPELST